MNCKKCGNLIETGAAFCTYCGTRVEYAADEPVREAETKPVEETAEFKTEPAFGGIYEKPQTPIVPPVPMNDMNQKVDFGKGGLAFCLVIIGILAITTGIFAGLYFSLV